MRRKLIEAEKSVSTEGWWAWATARLRRTRSPSVICLAGARSVFGFFYMAAYGGYGAAPSLTKLNPSLAPRPRHQYPRPDGTGRLPIFSGKSIVSSV